MDNKLIVRLEFVFLTTAKSMNKEEANKIVGEMLTEFGREYLTRADTQFENFALSNKPNTK